MLDANRPEVGGGRRRILVLALAALLLLLPIAAAHAANPTHSYLYSIEGKVQDSIAVPPPEGQLEDPCGVAVDTEGDVYVADYFHRTIDVYGPNRGEESGSYLTQLTDPDPDGPCNLAVDSGGAVFVNNWHRNLTRFVPAEFPVTEATTFAAPVTVDMPNSAGARSTGVALDPANGDLYVDDRTYVAVYSAAELAEPEPKPIRTIDLGPFGQGYGIAVSGFPATEGDIYVPDAVAGTVRVFDSTGAEIGQIAGAGTPQRGFVSLLDAGVAVDPTTGHVFVADDLEPGAESPQAAIDEFNAAREYRGQLPGSFVDSQPSALATTVNGEVLVTSGNTEGSRVDVFGPTEPGRRLEVDVQGSGEGSVISQPAGIFCGSACAAEFGAGEEVILTAIPAGGSSFVAWTGCNRSAGTRCTVFLTSNRTVSAEFGPAPSGLVVQAQTFPAATDVQEVAEASAPPATLRRSCPRRRHCRRKHIERGRKRR